MTIKRKNIRPSGLLEVEADNTDTVDTNGFSDAISVVSAETAKFSGGATMQANLGLRLGLTQVKINVGSTLQSSRSIVPGSDTNTINSANIVDVSINTFAVTPEGNNTQIVDVDFGSIITNKSLAVRYGLGTASGPSSVTYETFVSDDDIIYTSLGTQLINIGSGSTGILFTFPNTTWRFVRVFGLSFTGNPVEFRTHDVRQSDASPSSVTVRVRSSVTINTADGDVLIPDEVINENTIFTFDSDLLLTGNGEFLTLELVSFSNLPMNVNLAETTSIKEV